MIETNMLQRSSQSDDIQEIQRIRDTLLSEKNKLETRINSLGTILLRAHIVSILDNINQTIESGDQASIKTAILEAHIETDEISLHRTTEILNMYYSEKGKTWVAEVCTHTSTIKVQHSS